MNDPNAFSYSFSAKPAPKRPAPDAELFAVDQLSQFVLDNDRLLARNPRTGGELAMPAEHFNTLVAYCSAFRSLDEHVAELMEGSDGSPQRAAAIRQVVQSFRDARLTLSAQDICREVAPAPEAAPITERPIVVVITCDRPKTLERLLESMLENCDLRAVECCFVIDDSRSVENGDRNRACSQQAAKRAGAPIHYFGADEAHELTEALVAQLPGHREAIRFLLDRQRWSDFESFGVARNFSHLLSVGRPVVVFDDDTLCETWAAPYPADGVAFTKEQREVAFYRNHEEWQQGLTRRGHDPVAGHMQCLGLSLPEALTVLGHPGLQQSALQAAPLNLGRRLRPNSPVLITESGALGDPGTGGNTWLASMPRSSRERLAQTEGLLALALEQRCCWLGRGRPTFRPWSSISQVTGFDNRRFLPPYFPVTRGEDKLFGQVTRYIYPGSLVLDYAWAVPHLPLTERNWTADQKSYAVARSFPGRMVEDLLATSEDCLAVNPQERVLYLARLFEDLAAAPHATLLARATDDRYRYRASQARMLQQKINESTGLSPDWLAYLQDALREVQASQLGSFKAEDLKGTVGSLRGRDLLDFWKNAWRGFGRALPAWQEIREAAARLVAKSFAD